MNRFKLNYHQILALATLNIGSLLRSTSDSTAAFVLIFFGLIIFLVSSKLNVGLILSFFITALGAAFKIMHWPNGNEILLVGLVGLLVSAFFQFIYKKFELNLLLLYISAAILFMGLYFKVIHFQQHDTLILVGYLGILGSYMYRFSLKTARSFEDYNKLALVIFWCISALFLTNHWPYVKQLAGLTSLALWTWLITSFIREFKSNEEN